jgi:hypothetical protein
MSAFMNNIGATAVLLPAVVGISRKSGVPLSRLLIPLSFSSLMGGNMTIIGTPPNILASSPSWPNAALTSFSILRLHTLWEYWCSGSGGPIHGLHRAPPAPPPRSVSEEWQTNQDA